MKSIGDTLGIDLNAISDSKDAPFIHPTCPGARVYVTKDDLRGLVAGGEEFVDAETHVPRDGYGHARVRCGRPVQVGHALGTAGHPVYYALCSSCHGVEEANRADLRIRQSAKRESRSAAQ